MRAGLLAGNRAGQLRVAGCDGGRRIGSRPAADGAALRRRARALGLMIGLSATIPSLAVALFSVPIGRLSDRVGARRILVIGMSGYGLAGLLPLWLDSLPAIVASRFVVGVCEAAVMTASTTLISLYFSGLQRDRWLAAQVASTNVVGVLVVLAGGVAGEYGWRAPFFAYAIALVLLLPVLLLTFEPRRAAKSEATPGAETYAPGLRRLIALRCAHDLLRQRHDLRPYRADGLPP